MASLTRYQHQFIKMAIITCILIISFLLTLSVSDDEMKSRKMVLGSRPPTCVNRCMSCKPCVATLVVHTHRQHQTREITSNDYGDNNHDSYYLLSWKCKCGTKFFPP